MTKISVIMPLYNCEKFVKHSIASVQNQTYHDWELIIVNDASTDNSLAEAERFAAADERIKVLSVDENQGVSYCRNLAIEHATGDYITFLDSDDLWSKHKLEHQLSFMEEHGYALSHTSYAFMNEKGLVMEHGKVNVDPLVDMDKYMKTTQIGMSTVMIDRHKVKDIVFPNDRELCEDARLWMNFMRKGHKFHGLNEVLLLYRVRSHQLSHNKVKMVRNTLNRYWQEKDYPAYKRLYYFLNYACNGVGKRLRRPNIDYQSIYNNFNCRREN